MSQVLDTGLEERARASLDTDAVLFKALQDLLQSLQMLLFSTPGYQYVIQVADDTIYPSQDLVHRLLKDGWC